MDHDSRTLILDILRRENLLTLATVREDGYPQATTVGFVNDGLTIYVGAGADSRKVRNIRRCDKVSAAIDHDEPDWMKIQGLSLGGTAAIVSDRPELDRVGAAMMAKFPQWRAMPMLDPAALAIIRITPQVISLLDYTKGFGHTDLIAV